MTTPEMIKAVAQVLCRQQFPMVEWGKVPEAPKGRYRKWAGDAFTALTAAGYEVRPAASGPVMPEVARSVADEMDGRATRSTWVGKAIAAAIERGDK